MRKEIDPEETGEMNFSDFVALVLRHWKDVDAEEELSEAFSILSKNQPTISGQELKHMLTKLCE